MLARLAAPDCTRADYAQTVPALAAIHAGIDRLLLAESRNGPRPWGHSGRAPYTTSYKN